MDFVEKNKGKINLCDIYEPAEENIASNSY